MQGKGLISGIAILLLLVCLWQLSFTFFANRVEKKAESYAIEKLGLDPNSEEADITTNTDLRRVRREYLNSISNDKVVNLGLTKMTYQQAKNKSLNLGLDLQGGMSVVLQVAVDEAIKSMTKGNPDPALQVALQNANLAENQDDYVTNFIREYQKAKPGEGLASLFANSPEYSDKITIRSSDNEVEQLIRQETSDAIETTFEIIRARIDKFGVSSPNISLQKNRGRILVELPGVDDPERVRDLLQGEANLEFWETFEMNAEIMGYFEQANTALKALKGLDTTTDTDATVTRTVAFDENGDTSRNSLGQILDTDGNVVESLADLVTQAEKTPEELMAENPFYAIFIPNTQGGPVLGSVERKNKGEFEELMKNDVIRAVFPPNMLLKLTKEVYQGAEVDGVTKQFQNVIGLKTRGSGELAYLDGGVITDAQSTTKQNGEVAVTMQMNAEGAQKWKRMTGANVGKSVAVTLDDQVITYPTVNGEIGGGSTEISGSFSIEEGQDLANNLKIGKLPAPARIVEEATVGPSLGKKSIKSGLLSLIAGLSMVLMFMVYYYNKGGIISVLALLVNLFIIIGVLASLGATLTLPGIAGIVLTIGMAVDANVIIYERIREELAKGLSMKKAIAEGFQRSYSAIIDANITTLITAIVLFQFGLGPVLGFATILIIGILSSLFTAVLLTRLAIDWAGNRGIDMKFDSGLHLFKNPTFDFIKGRRKNYLASLIFITIGFLSMFTQGFELGVDFKGGRTYTVDFPKGTNTDDIANALKDQFGGVAPLVTTYDQDIRVTTSHLIGSRDKEDDNRVEDLLYEGVKGFFPASLTEDQFKRQTVTARQKVGPTIADDITRSSFLATAIALLCIFLYILIRFRKWQFSLAAVITIVHDTLILLSIFSIFHKILPFGMEINQSFIAALLTVIGYSINDTVVVFDRIREYLQEFRKKDGKEVINLAINSTLSRTVITSVTTFFVVLVLFIFGGQMIKGFAFALLIGIIVGTYSSIYIATPLVVDLSGEDVKLNEPRKGKAKVVKTTAERMQERAMNSIE